MGLVGTRWRLAEDMHRRGEASEETLPKATRRARKRPRERALPTFFQLARFADTPVIELSASLRLNYGEAMWYHTALWQSVKRCRE